MAVISGVTTLGPALLARILVAAGVPHVERIPMAEARLRHSFSPELGEALEGGPAAPAR